MSDPAWRAIMAPIHRDARNRRRMLARGVPLGVAVLAATELACAHPDPLAARARCVGVPGPLFVTSVMIHLRRRPVRGLP